MCNLYSITRGQEAMRRLFRITRDLTGNPPPLPAVYPDNMAPMIRVAPDGERELSLMRWGFPPPPNLGKAPVTNVRNLKSPYWRGRLKAEWRCLVPATSFCECTDSRPKVMHWFALDESRPIFAFAGIWRQWAGGATLSRRGFRRIGDGYDGGRGGLLRRAPGPAIVGALRAPPIFGCQAGEPRRWMLARLAATWSGRPLREAGFRMLSSRLSRKRRPRDLDRHHDPSRGADRANCSDRSRDPRRSDIRGGSRRIVS
jgi:hypothetical protein